MADDVSAAIAEFVRKNLVTEADAVLTPDTPLLTEGLVDSLGLTMLGAFLEERFGVFLEGSEIRAGATETIAGIADLVRRARS